jgi:glutaredoxin 3
MGGLDPPTQKYLKAGSAGEARRWRKREVVLRTDMPKIEIYTKNYCPYCHAAKDLLKRKGVPFTEIDIQQDRLQRDIMINRAGGRSTVPQIFIGAIHIGGSDDLHDLDDEGKLDKLLAA